MKKFMIILGIAFVLICGIFVGTIGSAQAEAKEISATDQIEAVAFDWIAEEHPDRNIEEVELQGVEKDEDYGGYRADFAYWFDGGTVGFYSVSMNSLD